ncbi:MAG: hypothetical protein HQ526_00530 [Actinobacteria bacterium]|nr:hypothetical protein [Actinomycetota bacterium]
MRISKLPFSRKKTVSTAVAVIVYYPLARLSYVLDRLGLKVDAFPLSSYRNQSFYTMRTDSLDRFGTKLEKRFSRSEIAGMLESAGFRDVTFSDHSPYWVCLSYRSNGLS